MTYPIIPLTIAWENAITETTITNDSQFGEGGVVARERRSIINNHLAVVDVAIAVLNKAEVEVFLRDRRGRPFRSVDNKLYICQSWQWSDLGVGVSRFQARIEEVKRSQL